MLYKNKALLDDMKKKARNTIKHLRWENYYNDIASTFKTIINEKKAGKQDEQ